MSIKSISLALRGPDGLAVIGRTLHDLRGIRYAEGEGGNEPPAAEEPKLEPAKPEAPKPEPPAQEDKTDWKAEARKWETRAKENSDAATRLKEIEDAQKTEQQKLEERASKAETEKAETAARLARYEAAVKHKITDENELKLLTGSTPDELEAQAAAIVAIRGAQGPNVPKPDPSIGPKEPTKPADLKGAIEAHYESA